MNKTVNTLNLVSQLMVRKMTINEIATRFKVNGRTAKRYLHDINNSDVLLVIEQVSVTKPAKYGVEFWHTLPPALTELSSTPDYTIKKKP